MGKFIDTTYKDQVKGITNFSKEILNNDFYYLNTQGKGTEVEYFNINHDKSSYDPGSGLIYDEVGDETPLRFNLIHSVFLFQFNRHELNFSNDEYGLEAGEIRGDSYILPNTFQPTEGDFFTVKHSNDTFLYKVTDADRDTLSNGANAWKISWILDRTTDKEVLQNVVKEYQYIHPSNNGSNVKPVVELTNYQNAIKIEEVSSALVNWFKDLFYSEYVQTFIYKWYNEYNMYDPYAMEFMIRNKLLYADGSNYMHVKHMVTLPNTFAIDYSRSVFYMVEEKDKKGLYSCKNSAQADLINDATSIFSTRYEQYFMLTYNVLKEPNGPLNPRNIIPIMDEDLVHRINENKKYGNENKETAYLDIFIKYFNDEKITQEDLDNIKYIDFAPVNNIFYIVLFLIYILDYYEKSLLS